MGEAGQASVVPDRAAVEVLVGRADEVELIGAVDLDVVAGSDAADVTGGDSADVTGGGSVDVAGRGAADVADPLPHPPSEPATATKAGTAQRHESCTISPLARGP